MKSVNFCEIRELQNEGSNHRMNGNLTTIQLLCGKCDCHETRNVLQSSHVRARQPRVYETMSHVNDHSRRYDSSLLAVMSAVSSIGQHAS